MAINRVDAFDQGAFSHLVDWVNHPTQGSLLKTVSRWVYNKTTTSYAYQECTVGITIRRDHRVKLTRCGANNFVADFEDDACVLLGPNAPGALPIHLVFDPPILALGAFMSAEATAGLTYTRQLSTKLEGAADWDVVTRSAPISTNQNTATFLGAETANGARITEAWFDVFNEPGNPDDVGQVAIGNLYFRV